MPDYLELAKKARTSEAKNRYLNLHRKIKIRSAIEGCVDCPLSESRTNAVPWSGRTTSPIVLVGEAPGHNEDKQGKPFVGTAGKILNRALAEAGLNRDLVMVVNTICCRPPKNRTPTMQEFSACQKHFDRQLGLSDSLVGVVMGRSAISRILGEEDVKVGEVRGEPFWAEGRTWVPTYHPAYIARNRGALYMLVQDLKLARDLVVGRRSWPTIDPSSIKSRKVSKRGFVTVLKKKGWALMYLKRLNTTVVIVKDEGIKVPRHLEGETTYTLEELARIGEIGVGKKMRDLEAVHLLKTYFPGARLVGQGVVGQGFGE